MLRTLAIMWLLAVPVPAFCQGIVRPFVPVVPTPVLPAPVFPQMGIFGTPGIQLQGHFGLGRGGFLSGSFFAPTLPYYGPFSPYFGFGQQTQVGIVVNNTVVLPAPAEAKAPLPMEPNWLAMAAAERPAMLAIQLPAEGVVVVDGKPQGPAARNHTLTSGPLPPGKQHTFRFQAAWTANGIEYTVDRTVEVAVGENSKLVILAGVPKAVR